MKQLQLLLICLFLNTYLIQSQNIITGTIISGEDNQALIGATIVLKGTTVAAQSDFNGKYSIKAQPDQTLVFSYVGFVTTEVAINGQSVIDMVLKPDVVNIEQVIVAGMAANTPKRKVSISVEKVNARDLEAVPGTSAASALQGKVSGVTIVSGSGSPGSSASIRLRGTNSVIGDSKPLIIVDGVMLEGELSDINVDDISSFEVVKGAASTALYGSKAGNGVIVITTKRGGSENKVDVRVRNEFGLQSISKEIQLSTHHPYKLADDYKQNGYTKYLGVSYLTGYSGGFDTRVSGTPDLDYDQYSDNPYSFNINQQKELFHVGKFYTNYFSIGSSITKTKTKYFFSIENNRNSGIVYNTTGSSRQNIRLNLDQQLMGKFKIKTSTLYSQNKLDLAINDATSSSSIVNKNLPFYNLLFVTPDIYLQLNSIPDTFTLKKYFYKASQWGNVENPLHQLTYEKNSSLRQDILQNINLDYQVNEWLSVNADFSIEKYINNNKNVKPYGYQSEALKYYNGNVVTNNQEGVSSNSQLTANFNKVIGKLVTRGKLSYQSERLDGSGQYKDDSEDFSDFHGLDSLIIAKSRNQVFKIRSEDYYIIFDADYLDRYIVSSLLRYDGSSLFGSEARWNPYYRFSLAWRVNEDLKLKHVEELKLRASVGTSGQRPGLNYQYESFQIIGNILKPYQLGNKNLKPSQTREFEIGIDAEMFKMLTLTTSFANNTTIGAYWNIPLSAQTGYNSQWTNAIDINCKTIEASLGINAIKSEKVNLKLNMTFDKTYQKIENVNTEPFFTGPYETPNFYIKKGEVFGVMYGQTWVRSIGQMEDQLPTGKLLDDYIVNSDGYVIEKGTEGTKYEKPIALKSKLPEGEKIANMNPKFNLTFSSSFDYNQWNLSMLWHWKNGGDVYNYTKQSIYRDNRHFEQDQSGKPENQKKAIGYYQTFYNLGTANSYFVENGSFLKLRELSLYYKLALKDMKYFKSIKFGILARNLLTLTKYSGWDPEVASASRGATTSNYMVDIFNYPNFRTYSGSVEIKF